MITFTLSKEKLLQSFRTVSIISDKKHSNPILSTILCRLLHNKLILTAFDSETELISSIDMTYNTNTTIFTVPAKKFVNILRNLPDNSNVKIIHQYNDQVIISSGLSRFRLSSLNPKLFLSFNVSSEHSIFKIPFISLLEALKRVQFSMANNDYRYFLNGMLWEIKGNKFKTVATDGHRMAASTTTINDSGIKFLQIIVPRKSIIELQKIMFEKNQIVEIQISKNYFKIIFSRHQFTSKLIDGNYPDYNSIVPKNNTKHLSANKDQLKQSLLRISILSNEQYRVVRLRLEKNELFLSSNNPENEKAEDKIPITYNYEMIEIAFNIKYLLDAINSITSKVINLYFDSAVISLLIKDADSQSFYVISPIRI